MIRIKAHIKNGKLILSEPINLEDDTEVDIIAYVERKDGKKFDKKTNSVQIEKSDENMSTYNENKKYNTTDDLKLKEKQTAVKPKNLSQSGEEDIQLKMKNLLNSVDLSSLMSLMYGEHPQLTAIIMEMLDKEKAKLFLELSPPELQGELIYRIAKQKKVTSTVMNQIYNILSRKLSLSSRDSSNQSGGMDTAIELLSSISNGAEKNVMRYIDTINKKFGQKLKKKLFTFDHIVFLDNDSITSIIDRADFNKLIIALKGVEQKVKDKFINNIEKKEQKDEFIAQTQKQSPVRIKDVEKAQQDILALIKELEDEGLLNIPVR